jgi:hypothetical protein
MLERTSLLAVAGRVARRLRDRAALLRLSINHMAAHASCLQGLPGWGVFLIILAIFLVIAYLFVKICVYTVWQSKGPSRALLVPACVLSCVRRAWAVARLLQRLSLSGGDDSIAFSSRASTSW